MRTILDLDLLDSCSPISGPEFDAVPAMPDVVRDKDGCTVPAVWHANVARYEKVFSLARRQESGAFEEARLAALAKKAARPARAYASRFTTQYAIDWGKTQTNSSGRKWTLIDRERYDFRREEHHDLELGVDAIFDDWEDGRVGVQGAGVGERKEHWERFIARGGPETALRRNIRVVYVEFKRGSKDPVKVEWWAPAIPVTEDEQ